MFVPLWVRHMHDYDELHSGAQPSLLYLRYYLKVGTVGIIKSMKSAVSSFEFRRGINNYMYPTMLFGIVNIEHE